MTRFDLFRVKNAMIIANVISNVIGVSIVLFLAHGSGSRPSLDIAHLVQRTNMIFIPFAFLMPLVLTLVYERPIRRYLNNRFLEKPLLEEDTVKARQKLLNEPFFLIALDFGIWVTAAVLYSMLFWAFGAGREAIHGVFLMNFYTGLITTTVAFFVFEFVLQRRVVPYFFPNGGLYMTPGTARIRIRTRLIAFLFACNLVPFFPFSI